MSYDDDAVIMLGPTVLPTRVARDAETETQQMGIPTGINMMMRVEDLADGTSLFFMSLIGERDTIAIIATAVRDKIIRMQQG